MSLTVAILAVLAVGAMFMGVRVISTRDIDAPVRIFIVAAIAALITSNVALGARILLNYVQLWTPSESANLSANARKKVLDRVVRMTLWTFVGCALLAGIVSRL